MRGTKFATFAALALFGALSTGCVKRELIAFADHDSKPLTAMNVMVTRNYGLWKNHEYVFYSCAEQGDQLVCKRLCGGNTELVCPAASGGGGAVQTNIR